MNQTPPYLVLAFYHFTAIADPHKEVALHKEFLGPRDATCRIYISEQGINGQFCAIRQHAEEYMTWMTQKSEFNNIAFKCDPYHEQIFPRQTIKYKKQLVAYDAPVNLSERGEHVSPDRWKQMLEEQKDRVLLDVRNDYEWKVGRFEGAELPPCATFREFQDYAERLKEDVDPKKTPVMMYCTGGIRCELYSAVLKEKGFTEVYQLDGGIINYGHKQGNNHWLGKLFVFDDRLTVPLCDEESPKIGTCHHCGTPNETYYNCANMDCNELFLSCPKCIEKFSGCCQDTCRTAERVRPYQHCTHKPFRKWYHYADSGIAKKQKG